MPLLSRGRHQPHRDRGELDPDQELDRELAAWVDELTARYEAQGLPRAEARRRALIDTEGVEQVKEHVRDARAWLSPRRLVDRLRTDLAVAFRSIRATPVAIAAAAITIAVAVGVNLAMVGLIDRALLSPPAHVQDPGRVFTVSIHGDGDQADAIRTAASYPTFEAIRDSIPALEGAAAFQPMAATVVVDLDQLSANGMLVSDEYIEMLGARPLLGSGIVADVRGSVPACVVSHAFWRKAFGGDRHALGSRIKVNGLDYIVTGVMPAGFSGHSSTAVDLWVTFAGALRNSPGWDRDVYRSLATVLVRLTPDATDAAVRAQAHAAIQQRISLSPIAGANVGANERRVAWWLTGVSGLVLLIGLANAGTLLVVRAARRRRDVAIHAALGATRGRLFSQAWLEACVLAAGATTLSMVAAWWLDESIRRVLFPGVIEQSGLSLRTWWAALCAGLLAVTVATAANLQQFRSATRVHALAERVRSHSRVRTLTFLLVVQTALAVVLLAGAGVFGRSLHNLMSQDFGMNMDGVVLVQFERNGPNNPRGAFEGALDAIRAVPGVELVTPITSVPFGGRHIPPISVPGRDKPPAVGKQLPFLNAATPEFMQILGVRVIDGRSLAAADDRGAPVVIVNETMAREVWPGERAVGKCIRIGFDDDFDPESGASPHPTKVACREVIGVAKDIRQRSLLPTGNEARLMQYFVPFSQVPFPPFLLQEPHVNGLLLRTSLDLDRIAPAIRRVIVGDRTDLPFISVAPYTQLLEPQLRPWRMATTLLVLFSALALGVAVVGLHAVFAQAVAERRHEMAIRVALGAKPRRVLRMVLREAAIVAGAGVIVGGAIAIATGRTVQALLFETAPSDPLVLGSAAALMLLVAAAATFIPALTASKADPSGLLKEQ